MRMRVLYVVTKSLTLKKLYMRIFILLVVSFISTAYFAQSESTNTDWLEIKFGTEEANQIIASGGMKLELYLFIDEHGHSIDNVAPKDISELPDALGVAGVKSEVPALTFELLSSDDFHAELYQFNRSSSEPVYYRIGDTGYLLKLESYKVLQERFMAQQ